MSLAAEAEVGALYINCRETGPACHTLEFMGHPQPWAPMQMDNTNALGIVNNNVIKNWKQRTWNTIGSTTKKIEANFDPTGPQAKKTTATTWQNIMPPLSPSNIPNFPHRHLYLTSTTPITHRQSSCSKGVLDIYYTTVWYNLHTYSKLHNEPLRPPVRSGTDRDQWSHHIFPVPRKQPSRQEWMIQ